MLEKFADDPIDLGLSITCPSKRNFEPSELLEEDIKRLTGRYLEVVTWMVFNGVLDGIVSNLLPFILVETPFIIDRRPGKPSLPIGDILSIMPFRRSNTFVGLG
jgi:hypothetical protein